MTDELFKTLLTMRLREAAKDAGLSYSDVARYTGICKTSVYNYFKGKRIPDLISLFKICEVLMINPRDLIDFDQYNVNQSFMNEGCDIYAKFKE